jgi:hypothetical protein
MRTCARRPVRTTALNRSTRTALRERAPVTRVQLAMILRTVLTWAVMLVVIFAIGACSSASDDAPSEDVAAVAAATTSASAAGESASGQGAEPSATGETADASSPSDGKRSGRKKAERAKGSRTSPAPAAPVEVRAVVRPPTCTSSGGRATIRAVVDVELSAPATVGARTGDWTAVRAESLAADRAVVVATLVVPRDLPGALPAIEFVVDGSPERVSLDGKWNGRC